MHSASVFWVKETIKQGGFQLWLEKLATARCRAEQHSTARGQATLTNSKSGWSTRRSLSTPAPPSCGTDAVNHCSNHSWRFTTARRRAAAYHPGPPSAPTSDRPKWLRASKMPPGPSLVACGGVAWGDG